MEIKIPNLSSKVPNPEDMVGTKLVIHIPSKAPRIIGKITKLENGDIYCEVTDKEVIDMLSKQTAAH